MWHLICGTGAFACLASGLVSTHNFLSSPEQSQGWILLFDGKTMDHWNDPRKLNPPGDAWTIEDGCLNAVPKPRITEDLVSNEKFRDFELQFEWRISTGGNSGVKYRIQAFPILDAATSKPGAGRFEDRVQYALEHRFFDRSLIPPNGKAQIYPVGFEYQLIDNANHPDARRGGLYQTGALYSIQAPAIAASKPVGEFNQSRLIVRGNHFEHWLNGQKVIDVNLNPAMLKQTLGHRWGEDSLVVQLLSDQPNKDCPITLQNHGSAAWFRDIKIRKF